MSSTISTHSIKRAARVAGLLYLIIFFAGPFSFFFVRSNIIVPSDATATANNIIASEALFGSGIVSDAVVFLSEVIIVSILYVLLRPVSNVLAMAAVLSRLAMAIMQGMNMLNYALPLLILNGSDYLSAFEPGQLNALMLLSLDAYEYVALIWGMFFGLHLVLLGYLVYKSTFFPKLIGILLLLSSLGYLLDSFGSVLVPQYAALFATLVIILALPGELSFTLWLLIKGVNAERWEERALAPAPV